MQLYAKGEPVHFVRTPAADPHVSAATRTYRSMLSRSTSPWSVLQQLVAIFSANDELARGVLLREGYLFADEPRLAFALVDLVSAQMLFNDKQIWVQRGERLLQAERSRTGHYVFVSGRERGERVRLMLNDRIGTGAPPPPLHRDFRALRQQLGFDRARIVHETETGLVVDLRYGSSWIRSLLTARGAHLELACELLGHRAQAVGAWRSEQAERLRLLEPLRRAMREQVDEGLPFDEPLTEYGQQDGQLRGAWRYAYLAGRTSFEFQKDRYYVFDPAGRPRTPQVCIDFIFDSLERAGGSWWLPRGQRPGRSMGKLDLVALAQLDYRRAASIVELAKARPDLLELYELPNDQRVPFKYAAQVADHLTQHADDYLPGDVVLIRGYAPWDKPWRPRVMHQHSFFVYETDPLSGMPIVLAGNPGRPVLQTWQFEAFRTPERSIQSRIRLRLVWLRQFVADSGAEPDVTVLTVDPREPGVPVDIPTPPGVDPGATSD